MAGRHGADSLIGSYGIAWRFQELDGATGDHSFFAESARHISGSLGSSDFGSCLRKRSEARHLHPRISNSGNRRLTRSIRLAGETSWTRIKVRSSFARIAIAYEQCPSHRRRRIRLVRHTLSVIRRCPESRQAIRGSSIFQHGVRAVDGAGDVFDWGRPNRALEAGEITGPRRSLALGFCVEPANGHPTAVRNRRVAMARKPGFDARFLDYLHRASERLEQSSWRLPRIGFYRPP